MINSCRDCKYSECKKITNDLNDNYSNWYCTYNGKKMIVNMSVRDSICFDSPSWCPIGGNLKKIDYEHKPIKKYMTTLEKKKLLESFEPKIRWEDIKVNSVYHVPPLLYEKRKDILITTKTLMSCTYKILSSSPKLGNGISYTMYNTSLMAKFIVPNKIKEIEVLNRN